MKKNKIVITSTTALILVAVIIFIIINNGTDKGTSKNIEIKKNIIIGDWDDTLLYRLKRVDLRGNG